MLAVIYSSNDQYFGAELRLQGVGTCVIFWIYLILVDSCDLVPQLDRKIDSPAQTFVFLEGYTTVRHTCRRLATWWSNKVSQVAFYILAKNLIIFPIDWNILSHIIPYYISHIILWLSHSMSILDGQIPSKSHGSRWGEPNRQRHGEHRGLAALQGQQASRRGRKPGIQQGVFPSQDGAPPVINHGRYLP